MLLAIAALFPQWLVAGTFYPATTVFAPTAVGAVSAQQTVTITASSSGSPSAPVTLTEGVSTSTLSEFTITDQGTCGTATSLSVGQTCTVAITFNPRLPGMRHGAVQLRTSGNQLLGSTLISGIGQGGLPVLVPAQIDTVVGDGQWFYQGDNVAATRAPIYLPAGLAVDGAGNLFLADSVNSRVRRVDASTQMITTVAGNGTGGASGDNGPATSASVSTPSGLALDGAGNLFIADTGNNAIRRVDAVTGIITTVAGTLGTSGYSGDNGAATSALLNAPQGIAISPSGDLLIADTGNNVIRVVSASDGTIQTVAGTGTAGSSGDGGRATAASLNQPSGVALRNDGAYAIADLSNNRVRLVTSSGTISTLAGDGQQGYAGDGGPATQAELQGPSNVAFDPAGDLFIADSVNNSVRLVYGPSQSITTLSGTPSDDRYAGDGGPEDQARMHGPYAVVFDPSGNLWISDRFNNRIRKVTGTLLTIGPYPTMKVGKVSRPVVESMLNAGNTALAVASPALQQSALDPATTTCASTSMAQGTLCNMGIEFAPTTVGSSVSGSVTWNTNAPNVTPVDALYGQVLSVEPTSVALTSSANPALVGQAFTLTATVTSADTGRTGTVDFSEGNTVWCSGIALRADGTAACQIPGLALGTHTFTAAYSGDNNNAASQSPNFVETIKQQAALALSASPNPAEVTSTVTLAISAADSNGTPTGTVTFYDGTTPLATVTLDGNGNAAWSTTSFSVGNHTITAQYAGDTSNMPGTTAAQALVVNQITTATVLTSSAASSTVNQPFTLTATVTVRTGSIPTGSVQFMDASTSLGSVTLDPNGTATLSLSALTPGTHTLSAVYSGNANDGSSSAAPIAHTVNQIATTTTLGADVDPAFAGAPVHLTAIVSAANSTAAEALAGTVTFSDGSNTLGTVSLNSSGEAAFTATTLSVGAHPITAHYNGETDYAASSSTVLAESVQQTSTSVTLASSASSSYAGKPVTFSATVSSQTGVPTGTIQFHDGSAILGTAPVTAQGTATLTTSGLASGVHILTASYSGDANYVASTSPALQQVVSLATPTLLLSGPAAPQDVGSTAVFSVAFSSPGVNPTGNISLLDGTVVIARQNVSGPGTVTFSVNTLAVGTHHITAAYSGDAYNNQASAAAISVTIQQGVANATLSVSANPIIQSQALTLTVVLTSSSPVNAGSVTFLDGTAVLTTVPVTTSGTASFVTSTLSLGAHTITAVFSGDTNHTAATSAAVQEQVVSQAGVAASSSANPSISGHSINIAAVITGAAHPTGSVNFLEGPTLLATRPLDATGTAVFTTDAFTPGTHNLTLQYSGDKNLSQAEATLAQTVLDATTATTLTVDANPAVYSKLITLSAAVSTNGSIPTGSVTILDAGQSIGTAPLGSTGQATLGVSTLSLGSHQLMVTYAGDGKAAASSSQQLLLVVKQSTTLNLTTSANPAQTLGPVTLTATVQGNGPATPTGAITFTDGAAVLGSATLDAGGHATLTLPAFSAGVHQIAAAYPGDSVSFAAASSVLAQQVNRRPTTVTVTGADTDPANPQQVTLIAVVHGTGSQPPSGLVTFSNGSITLGAASVDSTGVATITVIFAGAATQQVTVAYEGDAAYDPSQSTPTPVTAGQPAQFTIAVATPTLTVASHQHATVTVQLSSIKGFTDKITLGCLGLPYAATCTFDHSQVQLQPDGTVTASLVVDTGDPLGAGSNVNAKNESSPHTLLCFSPALLLLLALKRRRRSIPFVLGLAVLLGIGASGLQGCSGLQVSGTPVGTYSFKVVGTGAGSNVTQLEDVTLVVTQ